MSENTPNRVSEPKDVEGATARIRTQSECSFTSDDGNSTSSTMGKRQRTTSQTFMVTSGITSASPPKFVSLEEIMQAANSMKDMALVHQIVVDKDFRLERYEPEPNSVQKLCKDTVHRAFWDILRKDINDDPPNYTQALTLFQLIKEGIFDLLLPQHTKLRQQISEVLDADLIKQQAENGILDFKYYAQYVISIMSKLCAPVRDDKIKELTEMTEVVDSFCGILETLDLMALDMANFTIEIAKPNIIAHSVQLERKKFSDFLAIQPDGLKQTRAWLLEYLDTTITIPENTDRTAFIRNLAKETVVRASIELLEMEPNAHYPETFILDVQRLIDLQKRTERAVIIGTVLLIILSNVGSDLSTLAVFKQSLKEHCSIIIDSYKHTKDLEELLPNVAIQVINDIKIALHDHSLGELSPTQEKNLTDLITDVKREDHKIKVLVKQRIKEFLLQIISSATAAPQKVPTGLTALQKELITIAGQFLKIISHNTSVFCIYYFDIIDNALPKSA